METEWKRNVKKNRNQVEIKLIGMEWNQNGKFSTEKDNVQWNGNRMEKI